MMTSKPDWRLRIPVRFAHAVDCFITAANENFMENYSDGGNLWSSVENQLASEPAYDDGLVEAWRFFLVIKVLLERCNYFNNKY